MNDTIYRQAAIAAMTNYFARWAEYTAWSKTVENMVETAQEAVREMLTELPSAQTELAQDLHNACTDAISRQAAIDALAKVAREKFNLSDEFNHYLAGLMDGEYAIRQLPSVQPERKNGKWLKTGQSFVFPDKFRNYFCSECGFEIEKTAYNYCPNCGCRMMEVEHETD